MSLKWIQENLEAPTCDEECSDIDDSGTDDSYDSDLLENRYNNNSYNNNNNHINSNNNSSNENDTDNGRRKKRETTRPPTTTVTFDENGAPRYTTHELDRASCELWDPRKCIANPAYKCQFIKLLCRTGYHLTISSSGRVSGQINIGNQDRLKITSVSYGVIKIQNPQTGHYLAFNKKGHLYGELKGNKENTEWEQWSIGLYEAFRSRKYAVEGWWVGIKKNGRPKAGPKTAWAQKSIQFSVTGFN